MNRFFYFISIFLLIFLFFFLITCSWIGYDVREKYVNAQERYEGDCVEALMQSFEEKPNNADVWALGQMGDKRALPLLKTYTEEPETKGAWAESFSHYELNKAIKLLNGFNASAVVWR